MKTILICLLVICAFPRLGFSQLFAGYEIIENRGELPSPYQYIFDNIFFFYTDTANHDFVRGKHIKLLSSSIFKHLDKKKKEHPDNKKAYRFDENANMVEYAEYNSKEKIKSNERFQYDKNNRITESLRTNSKGAVEEKRLSEYNEMGYRTAITVFNRNNKIVSKQTAQYNDSGHIAEKVYYKRGGSLIKRKYTYQYNSEGKLAGTIVFNAAGKIRHKWVYDCNPTGETVKNLKDTSRVCVKYDYDSLGNKIQILLTTYNKNRIIKQVSKYDKNDRITESLMVNPNEVIIFRQTTLYDNDGNITGFIYYKRGGEKIRFRDTYTFTKGLRTETVFCYGDKGKCSRITYSYDSNNLLTEIKYFRRGQDTFYELKSYNYEIFK